MLSFIPEYACGNSLEIRRNADGKKHDVIWKKQTSRSDDASFIELYSECEKQEEKKDD